MRSAPDLAFTRSLTSRTGASERAIRPFHLVILALLVALQICAAIGSNGTWDTYRDLYFAQRISAGAEFPLSGPGINAMLHLGPWWFYLLAAALWLVPNPATLPVTIALLGALQFPLAYQLGRRCGSTRLGLLFALALLLPGWSAFRLVLLTHVTLVGTCVLLGVLAAWRYRERPRVSRAGALGLAFAAMLHAHPTTLLLAIAFTAWALWPRQWRARVAHAGVIAVIVLLAFAPMLLDQWRHGFPDLARTTQYASVDVSTPSPLRALRLLPALFDYGADYVTRYWLQLPRAALNLLLALNALILLAAAGGAAWRARTQPAWRGPIAALVALLLAQTLFVVALRPITPYWMIYAQLPLIAALVALGLDALWQLGARARVGIIAATLTWTVWSAACLLYIALAPWQLAVERIAPGAHGLMDIGEHQRAVVPLAVARLPIAQLYAIAEPLCAPVTLYAHYAHFVELSFGVGARAQCGTSANVELGGPLRPGRAALLGLRDYAWDALGATPSQRIGALGIATPDAVWHSPQALMLDESDMFPARRLVIAPRRFSVEGEATADAFVLVAHRAPRYSTFNIAAVHADGVEVAPAYRDDVTAIYRAPAAAGPNVHWKIQIEATPEYVDVLTFRGR